MKRLVRQALPAFLLFVLLIEVLAGQYASAQSVQFGPVEKALPVPRLQLPATSFVADSAGNIFYIDPSNNSLTELTTTGSTRIVTNSPIGPNDIKIDTAGNIYVEDNDMDDESESPDFLWKVTPSGNATVIETGLRLGVNVHDERLAYFAADAAGNIYESRPQLVERLAPNGTTVTLASGFLAGSITVDANGNVFVEDFTNSRVLKISSSGTQTALLSGLSFPGDPNDLVVDSAGNLYISCNNSKVVKLSPAGVQTLLFSGDSFDIPSFNGIALDSSGNLFAGVALTPSNAILKLAASATTFGDFDFGAVPQSFKLVQPVTFSFTNTVSVASLSVLTNGAPNQDFQAVSGGTCAPQTFSAGQTCTVNVQFAPTKAGFRYGAVVLNDSLGNVLSTVNLRATGLVYAQALNPGVQKTVLSSGLKDPSAVAVNGLGDIFIVDKGNSRVVKISASGTQSTVGSGLISPTGVAEDGAGNIYITDTANDRVVKVTPNGTQTTILSGLNTPDGVAVDGDGNLYVADAGNNRVLKLAADGVTQSTVGSGFSRPTGVAVDGAGDVFVADFGHNQVVKVAANGAQTTVIANLSSPSGVSMDAAGNLYVAEVGTNQVVEVPTTATSVTPTVLVGGLNFPFDAVLVAVNSAGDLFVADTFNNRVLQIDRSQSNLNFGTVTVGQSSTAQTVTVQLVANDFLDSNFIAPSPTVTAVNNQNFQAANNFSNCTLDLNSNNFQPACTLTVTFTPKQSGNLTASVTVQSSGGSQVVTFSGTGH